MSKIEAANNLTVAELKLELDELGVVYMARAPKKELLDLYLGAIIRPMRRHELRRYLETLEPGEQDEAAKAAKVSIRDAQRRLATMEIRHIPKLESALSVHEKQLEHMNRVLEQGTTPEKRAGLLAGLAFRTAKLEATQAKLDDLVALRKKKWDEDAEVRRQELEEAAAELLG